MRALRLALAIAAAGSYLTNGVFVLAEDSIDPGLDGTLNHVQYAAAGQPPAAARQQEGRQKDEDGQPSTASSGGRAPFSAEHAARKAQLLASMAPPADGSRIDFDEEHPRFRVLRAMYGFARHQTRYQTDLAGWEDGYKAIPERHRDIIRRATDYETLHAHVHDLYAVNGRVAAAVVDAARDYYGVSQDELDRYVAVQEYNEKWDNQERVTEALQHLFRDWAAEGRHERDVPFDAIVRVLARELPAARAAPADGADDRVRVLVPGSGLGRLAHDIAARLPGAAVTANEYSAYMRLVYRLVETLTPEPAAQMTLHPFIDWWSHQASRAGMTRAVRFPDAAPDPSVLLVEGDFTTEFANQSAHYDAVATFFFVDTATNMLDYLDQIARVLKPGGLWVNLGPLLYHKAAVELSLDDVMAVAEEYGFEFVDVDEEWGPLILPARKARTRDISYLCDTDSLRRNVYSTALFAARLKKD